MPSRSPAPSRMRRLLTLLAIATLSGCSVSTEPPDPVEDARNRIEAFADNPANQPPTAADYSVAGIQGVTGENLAAVNAAVSAAARADVDTVEELQALVDRVVSRLRIIAWADGGLTAPALTDYARLGITGVTAANLDAMNAGVAASIGTEVDTAPELQAVVNRILILLGIAAYADDDRTAPVPTVANYAAAGITGVTAENLAAVNAAVQAVTGVDVDTGAELQTLVNRVLGLLRIAAYATNEANPAPTLETYQAVGVTGVTAANLAAVNRAVVDLIGADVDAVEEVQALVLRVVAQLRISAYATDDAANPAPALESYTLLGITGVTAANLAEVNRAVAALTGPDVDTPPEVQAVVDRVVAQLRIAAYAADDVANPAPTVATYATIGVTGVTAANLTDVNRAVAALTGPEVDTAAEVQTLVDRVAAQLRIAAYASDDAANPAPVLATYTTIGVSGVTAANLADVNRAVAALTGPEVDTPSEVQAVVTRVVAQLRITAYAANDAANPAPLAETFTAIGVTGVTGANLAEVNRAIAALTGPDVDTAAEVQSVVDRVVAQLRIAAYATDDQANPIPTLDTYLSAGVIGLTAAMVPGMNRAVAALSGPDVDTLGELQALANGVITEAAIAPAVTTFRLERTANPLLDSTVTGVVVGDTIRLVVPKIVPVTALVPTFTLSAPRALVSVGFATQSSGVSAGDFTSDVRYTVTSVGGATREYVVKVVVWTGLPVVTLTTDGGAPIVSREVYLNGTVAVYGGKDRPEWTVATVPTQVKGRGNSTWYNPKKPYRLKLTTGRSMLGAPSDRDWTLLANYWDLTLARNALAFEMSRIVGMAYTPRCQPVELILNGTHQGAYQLCEHMETNADRVPAGPGGWLVELNDDGRLDPGDVYFQTPRIATFSAEWGGSFFVYKTPDPPTATQDSVIQAQINRFETNLFSTGFAHPDTGYAAHLDVESLIDWYLVQELTKNNDAMFINSVYLYAKAGGKITFGPLWDFDLAFGGYPLNPEPQGWRVRNAPWIERLFDDRAFLNRMKTQWQALYAQRSAIDAGLVAYAARLRESQRLSHALWYPYEPKPNLMAPFVGSASALALAIPGFGTPGSLFTDAMYDAEVQTLRTWLSTRFAWLNAAIMDL